MKWFAVQSNELDDVNYIQMSWDQRGRFDALRKLAARLDDCGRLTQNGKPLEVHQIAVLLRDDPAELKAAVKVFKQMGVIFQNGHGLEFPNWTDQQKPYYDKNRRKPAETGGERREAAETGPTPHHTTPEDTTPHQTTPQDTTPPAAPEDDQPGSEQVGGVQSPAGDGEWQEIELTKDQEKRAAQVRSILAAASVGGKKALETSVLVATRINKLQYIPYVLGALASCYDDPEVKNPGLVAVSRIERAKVPEKYLSPGEWRKVPAEVLHAAGIDNLTEYIVRRVRGH